MRRIYVTILFIITAFVGIFFNFLYVINDALDEGTLNGLKTSALDINYISLFAGLALVTLSFFFRRGNNKFFGVISFIMGLLFLIFMISFTHLNFYYLIPFGLYLISGSVALRYKGN